MRKNQVSIKIERFGDQVSKDCKSTHQKISAYADSNVFSDALLSAIAIAMMKIEDPNFRKYDTKIRVENEDPDDPKQILNNAKRKLSEMARAARDERKELAHTLFAAEHAVDIARIASTSKSEEEAIERIRDEFNLDSPFYAQRLLDASLRFATKNNIDDLKAELDAVQLKFGAIEEQLNDVRGALEEFDSAQ